MEDHLAVRFAGGDDLADPVGGADVGLVAPQGGGEFAAPEEPLPPDLLNEEGSYGADLGDVERALPGEDDEEARVVEEARGVGSSLKIDTLATPPKCGAQT